MAIHYDLNRIASTQTTRQVLIPHIKSHHPETQIHSVDLVTVPPRKEVIIQKAPEMIIHNPDEANNAKASSSKPLNGFRPRMLPPKKRPFAESDVGLSTEEQQSTKAFQLPLQLLTKLKNSPQQWLDDDPQYLSLLMRPLQVKLPRGEWKPTDLVKLTPALLPKKNQKIVLDDYRPPPELNNRILDASLDNVKRDLKRNLTNMELRMKQVPVAQFPDDPQLHGYLDENGGACHKSEQVLDEDVHVLDEDSDDLEVVWEAGTEEFDRALNIDGNDDTILDETIQQDDIIQDEQNTSPDSILKEKIHHNISSQKHQEWHWENCRGELKVNLLVNLDGQLDEFEDEYTPGQPIKTEAGEPEQPAEEPAATGEDPLDCMEFDMTSEAAATKVCDDE